MKSLQIITLLLASRVFGGSSGCSEASDNAPSERTTKTGPISSDPVTPPNGFSQEGDYSFPEPTIQTGRISSGAPSPDSSPQGTTLPPYYEKPTQTGSIGPTGIPTSYQEAPEGSPGSTPEYDEGGSPESPGGKGYRSILYYTNWLVSLIVPGPSCLTERSRGAYSPEDIPADEISHLLYSFANVEENGRV